MAAMADENVFRGGWNPQWHSQRGKAPTRRQEIFEFIIAYADEHQGNSPSIRRIKSHFALAYGTVHTHVMKLIKDGRLRQDEDGHLVVIGSEWIPPE